MAFDRSDAAAECRRFPGVDSYFPFGPTVEVFRVGSKMFALLGTDGRDISLKCDPVLAEVLRQNFEGVTAGYHLNKRHWNTVRLDGSVPDEQVREMIEHSYRLVFDSLPKRERARIEAGG